MAERKNARSSYCIYSNQVRPTSSALSHSNFILFPKETNAWKLNKSPAPAVPARAAFNCSSQSPQKCWKIRVNLYEAKVIKNSLILFFSSFSIIITLPLSACTQMFTWSIYSILAKHLCSHLTDMTDHQKHFGYSNATADFKESQDNLKWHQTVKSCNKHTNLKKLMYQDLSALHSNLAAFSSIKSQSRGHISYWLLSLTRELDQL